MEYVLLSVIQWEPARYHWLSGQSRRSHFEFDLFTKENNYILYQHKCDFTHNFSVKPVELFNFDDFKIIVWFPAYKWEMFLFLEVQRAPARYHYQLPG